MEKDIKYYAVEFKIENSIKYYMLWFSGEYDRFLTKNGKLLIWGTYDELLTYAKENSIDTDADVSYYDTAAINYDIDSCENCRIMLDMWNILSDLAISVTKPFMGDEPCFNGIYAKLTAGCDLPDLEKCKFTVSWSSSEILEIKEVLNSGINILLDTVSENCGGVS